VKYIIELKLIWLGGVLYSIRISDKEIFDFWTARNNLERDVFFW
jgi:hypothetical protein